MSASSLRMPEPLLTPAGTSSSMLLTACMVSASYCFARSCRTSKIGLRGNVENAIEIEYDDHFENLKALSCVKLVQ